MHSGRKIRFFDEKRRQKCEISPEICKKLVKKQVFCENNLFTVAWESFVASHWIGHEIFDL